MIERHRYSQFPVIKSFTLRHFSKRRSYCSYNSLLRDEAHTTFQAETTKAEYPALEENMSELHRCFPPLFALHTNLHVGQRSTPLGCNQVTFRTYTEIFAPKFAMYCPLRVYHSVYLK